MEKQMETNSSILAWENPMDGGSWGSNSPWGLKTVGHDLVTKMTKKKIKFIILWAFLEAQMVKYLPAMLETQVQSLGREDPLEKRMVTHTSIPAWRISWTEQPGRLQSMG